MFIKHTMNLQKKFQIDELQAPGCLDCNANFRMLLDKQLP